MCRNITESSSFALRSTRRARWFLMLIPHCCSNVFVPWTSSRLPDFQSLAAREFRNRGDRDIKPGPSAVSFIASFAKQPAPLWSGAPRESFDGNTQPWFLPVHRAPSIAMTLSLMGILRRPSGVLPVRRGRFLIGMISTGLWIWTQTSN